jgi:nucleotide-binding universal stress UspA family protein
MAALEARSSDDAADLARFSYECRGFVGITNAVTKGMSAEHSHVVIGFDFGRSGRAALDRAIGLATRAPWHVLHFACVIDPHVAFPALPTKHIDIAYAARVQEEVTAIIVQELDARRITDRVHFFVHARIGKPAAEILGVAKDVGADLIIVGSKGLTGIERMMIGSVSERVVREAGCSVEVARPKTYEYVPLTQVVDAERHHKYVPPHRYTYESQRASRRPNDWPLY